MCHRNGCTSFFNAYFIESLSSDREEKSCYEDGSCHGNAGEERTHHDELGRKVFAVLEFDSVQDGIDGGWNGRHDQNRLIDGLRKFDAEEAPYVNQDVRGNRSKDQADAASEPCVDIPEGDLAPVDLHAKGNHDDGCNHSTLF